MAHGLLHAGQQQRRIGGKDQVRPLGHRIVDGRLRRLLSDGIFIGEGIELVIHGILQQVAAALMLIDPAGGIAAAGVDEGGAQTLADGMEGEQGLFHRVLQHKGHPGVFQPVAYLLPDHGQFPGDLGGQLALGSLIAKQLHIYQESQGDVLLIGILPQTGIPEHIVKGAEIVDLLRAPRFPAGPPHGLHQLPVLSRSPEHQEIQPCHLVEVEELVVGGHLRVVGGPGQKPGDHRRNGDGPKVFQHAHPLVAFHHIEAVEVFHRFDGVPDSFIQVGLTEGRPLACKLAVSLQGGIKAGGKAVAPQLVAGTHDELAGHLHHAQALPPHGKFLRIAGQHLQAGFLPPGCRRLDLLLSQAERIVVFLQYGHIRRPPFQLVLSSLPTNYHDRNKNTIPFSFRLLVFGGNNIQKRSAPVEEWPKPCYSITCWADPGRSAVHPSAPIYPHRPCRCVP